MQEDDRSRLARAGLAWQCAERRYAGPREDLTRNLRRHGRSFRERHGATTPTLRTTVTWAVQARCIASTTVQPETFDVPLTAAYSSKPCVCRCCMTMNEARQRGTGRGRASPMGSRRRCGPTRASTTATILQWIHEELIEGTSFESVQRDGPFAARWPLRFTMRDGRQHSIFDSRKGKAPGGYQYDRERHSPPVHLHECRRHT